MLVFFSAGLVATLFAYLSYVQKQKGFLIFAFVIMWFIAAFQDCIASDFIAYKAIFEGIRDGRSPLTAAFIITDRETQIEIGWYVLNEFVALLSPSFYVVTALVYLFVFSVFFQLIYKCCPERWRWVAVFYLFFTPGWLTAMMSAQRQIVAVSFFVLMLMAIIDKKYKRAVLFAIFGICFHFSFIVALPFALLLVLPYEKISFKNKRTQWFVVFIVIFILAFTLVQDFVDNTLSLFFEADEESADVYDKYIKELMRNDLTQRITTIIARLSIFVFVVWAFIAGNSKSAQENMFFAFFLVSYILFGVFGNVGSIGRIFRYPLFFSLPAVSITAHKLKGEFRLAFIVILLFMSVYSLFSAFGTDQFSAYKNYHTVFSLLF